MPSIFSSVFSNEDINYLLQLPEVAVAKAKLGANSGKIYFTIPLTDTIRVALHDRLGLDFSNVSEIPMRWIKGDTESHADSGSTQFENTYLVYLNDSDGEFILDTNSYPISANTGFVFNEGILHSTQNTGTVPRLLLGPMNEFANPVGGPANILYFSNHTDAMASTNVIAAQYNTFVIGDTPNITSGSIGAITAWRIARIYDNGTQADLTNTYEANIYNNTFNLGTLNYTGVTFYLYPAVPCFLEGTQVLCQVDGIEKYLPIETIEPGTLVKTSRDGYKKVELIGKGIIYNPDNNERIQNRLFKCSTSKYPELKEDLYITGAHSILVDTITDVQREGIVKSLGNIFVTDKKYRLVACVDERAEPWISEGNYTIWHLALENENIKMNYGIYVNGGLLVETCSINSLKNRYNMSLM